MSAEWFQDRNVSDVIVIGGGLSGLTAAALAARSGRRVVLLERSRQTGGRAATTLQYGVKFNLGPHALYCEGAAFRILTGLDVPFRGAFPSQGRGLFLVGRRRYSSPGKLTELVTSPLFTMREKWTLARLPQSLLALDPRELDRVTVADWVREFAGTGRLAEAVLAFLRLSTFVHDPDEQSAGAALEQVQVGLRGNVWYLDEGWQSLIDGLEAIARSWRAEVRRGASVVRVESDDDGVLVTQADGQTIRGRTAIIAVGPEVAERLVGDPGLETGRPARVATLDVALTSLPRPDERFTLGLDRPLYFSVHSAAARLGPDGIAVLHVMRYLGAEKTSDSQTIEQELEDVLDSLQPGWRKRVHSRRFLPNMVVTAGIPRAETGGNSGRPAGTIANQPRVFLAGDWIGPEGQLADAAAASAQAAVDRALKVLDGRFAHVESNR